jgi:hypothetical protein
MKILPELKNKRSILNKVFRESHTWFSTLGRHAVLVNQNDEGEITLSPITREMLLETGADDLLRRVELYDTANAVVVLGFPSQMFMTLTVVPDDELDEKTPQLEPGWLRRIMTERKSAKQSE